MAACFNALGVDRVYAIMCRNQHCFRARVSPKPWRIGISTHLKPRPGVWPVSADRMEERKRWVGDYEAAAADYASCRFVEALGKSAVHPKVRDVQALHDRLSLALSDRKLA